MIPVHPILRTEFYPILLSYLKCVSKYFGQIGCPHFFKTASSLFGQISAMPVAKMPPQIIQSE